MICDRCEDEAWICEKHPDLPFEHDDCPGPGMPCPDCNDPDDPVFPPGSIELIRFR